MGIQPIIIPHLCIRSTGGRWIVGVSVSSFAWRDEVGRLTLCFSLSLCLLLPQEQCTLGAARCFHHQDQLRQRDWGLGSWSYLCVCRLRRFRWLQPKLLGKDSRQGLTTLQTSLTLSPCLLHSKSVGNQAESTRTSSWLEYGNSSFPIMYSCLD